MRLEDSLRQLSPDTAKKVDGAAARGRSLERGDLKPEPSRQRDS